MVGSLLTDRYADGYILDWTNLDLMQKLENFRV